MVSQARIAPDETAMPEPLDRTENQLQEQVISPKDSISEKCWTLRGNPSCTVGES